ncbi:hypothetical protein ACO2Q2_16340 [Dyella sp. KRB-257]|uniref:hypothetical protein n=1 Tax=Dyella sp. KRB-257 TaxID=3400915 RepID=UPI003BFB65A8
MTDHASVVDLLKNAAAEAAAVPESALEVLLSHAVERGGASGGLLLSAGMGGLNILATHGVPLPEELVQAVLNVENESALAAIPTQWMWCRATTDGACWVTHRSVSHGYWRTMVILAFAEAPEESAGAHALGDWLLLIAVIWTKRNRPSNRMRKQERDAAHRINNALGAITMHSDLGALLSARLGSEKLHRLFREIAEQTAVCAVAVRAFLRRG